MIMLTFYLRNKKEIFNSEHIFILIIFDNKWRFNNFCKNSFYKNDGILILCKKMI